MNDNSSRRSESAEATFSKRPSRSADLDWEMLPQTKLFSKGVFDQHSGVQFVVRDKNIVAVLDENSVTLTGVPTEAIKETLTEGVFPPSIRKSFTELVVPQLIAPAKHALVEEIRKFKEGPHQRDSNIREVTIQADEPFEFSLRGVLYSGRTFAEYEGSLTWNKLGNLVVTAYGHSKRVPLGYLVNGNQSMLEMVLSQIGKLHATSA